MTPFSIKGVAYTFNHIDLHSEAMSVGAFKKSLATLTRPIPILATHNTAHVIGHAESVYETNLALMFTGKLYCDRLGYLDTDGLKMAIEEKNYQISIGGMIKEIGGYYDMEGNEVALIDWWLDTEEKFYRLITEFDLKELSLVPIPADTTTKIELI
jgi:HK97 family phage prohead protease